ncbi:hypothetical protein NHH03_25220 [Stieleria sp. TO1_6]|uniref:hypothetical protein n=1 Tax=Stieleria tagensis TaxID=2956795 RepID=UPI00209A9659|nr:hypothetical protein [Stieleria tagensis]MCO8125062.1 hypothetical protein [Stieleria tagensis]
MNQRPTTVCVIAMLLAWGGADWAGAQIVQLPSFSYFNYSGSVLVPDRGSTSLGGISRASLNSRRGLLQRRTASSLGHGGATAHVTIIDHDAMDRRLRGLPPAEDAVAVPARRVDKEADIPVRQRPIDADAEGKVLVRYARKQFLAGKKAAAFDAYCVAIDSLSPQLAELADAEFRRVFPNQQRPHQQ